jgi:hypothetical protein
MILDCIYITLTTGFTFLISCNTVSVHLEREPTIISEDSDPFLPSNNLFEEDVDVSNFLNRF